MYNTSVSVPPPNTKSTEDYMRMIKINPFSLQHIPNPTEEMKLTALRENGLVLEFIDHPTKEMKLVALKNTAKAIQFIPDAPKELLEQAYKK